MCGSSSFLNLFCGKQLNRFAFLMRILPFAFFAYPQRIHTHDREGCAYNFSSKHSDREGQYIAKKRPSGFVILSGAKDLSPDRDPSLRSELAQDAKRRDD